MSFRLESILSPPDRATPSAPPPSSAAARTTRNPSNSSSTVTATTTTVDLTAASPPRPHPNPHSHSHSLPQPHPHSFSHSQSQSQLHSRQPDHRFHAHLHHSFPPHHQSHQPPARHTSSCCLHADAHTRPPHRPSYSPHSALDFASPSPLRILHSHPPPQPQPQPSNPQYRPPPSNLSSSRRPDYYDHNRVQAPPPPPPPPPHPPRPGLLHPSFSIPPYNWPTLQPAEEDPTSSSSDNLQTSIDDFDDVDDLEDFWFDSPSSDSGTDADLDNPDSQGQGHDPFNPSVHFGYGSSTLSGFLYGNSHRPSQFPTRDRPPPQIQYQPSTSLPTTVMPAALQQRSRKRSYAEISDDAGPSASSGANNTNKRRRTSNEISSRRRSPPPSSRSTNQKPIEEINLVDDDDDEDPLAKTLRKQQADAVKAQQQRLASPGGSRKSKLSSLQCTVCLDATEDLTATTCGHTFCRACLMNWLVAGEKEPARRPNCPACRKPLKRLSKTDIIPLEIMKKRVK